MCRISTAGVGREHRHFPEGWPRELWTMADHKADATIGSVTCRLQVLSCESNVGGEQEGAWQDAGPIQIVDEGEHTTKMEVTASSVPNRAPSRAEGSTRNVRQARQSVPRRGGCHKKALPRRVKLLLSPKARVKSDRRANFRYRHSFDGIDTNLLVLVRGVYSFAPRPAAFCRNPSSLSLLSLSSAKAAWSRRLPYPI